jgi:cytochrome c-type biogenesis protein CcmF
MFCCAAFALGSVGQEFWRGTRVRRAMAREPIPVALGALVRRNRRRYGGYIVHIGMAVLFIGVAASSSFQHQTQLSLTPGQSTKVGPYTIHYLRASAAVTPPAGTSPTQVVSAIAKIAGTTRGLSIVHDPAQTGSTLNIGAVLSVTRGSSHIATLTPSQGYYDSGQPIQGSVGHLIGGQAVSHVSMSAGVTRDIWSAMQPNIETPALKRIIEAADKTIPYVRPDEGALALAYMANAYLQHPPAAQFNFIDSPLVLWIWIGGLIVFGGGLIVLWPAPSAVRRRVSVLARGRGARGLARA